MVIGAEGVAPWGRGSVSVAPVETGTDGWACVTASAWAAADDAACAGWSAECWDAGVASFAGADGEDDGWAWWPFFPEP